eukprot:6776183-Ditylum_brightwellii.AAC.1
MFKFIDHHWAKSKFVSASNSVLDICDPNNMNFPSQSYNDLWGSNNMVAIIWYNPAESYLAVTASADHDIGLFDTCFSTPLKKAMISMLSNCIQWSPMEPNIFVVGGKYYNTYSFDMMTISMPKCAYIAHIVSQKWYCYREKMAGRNQMVKWDL